MSKALLAEIPYVHKPVSRIFFGTGSSNFMFHKHKYELLDKIFASGINAFDTARVYLFSEKTLGGWMKARGNREKVVLLSKCAHPNLLTHKKRVNPREIKKDLEASCKALQTEFIDIYLLHRDDPEMEVGPLVEVFNELHEQKRIGAFGGSNWTHARIQTANEYADRHHLIPFTVSSPHFGLAEMNPDSPGSGLVSISGAANAGARSWYQEKRMPVVAYSSLGSGLLSGRVKGEQTEDAGKVLGAYAMQSFGNPQNFERLRRVEKLAAERGCAVAQIVLAWIFCQPMNVFPVISTASAIRMKMNLDALNIELSEDEASFLNIM